MLLEAAIRQQFGVLDVHAGSSHLSKGVGL